MAQLEHAYDSISPEHTGPRFPNNDPLGVGIELTKHARTLKHTHPDRATFLVEAARLSVGGDPSDSVEVLQSLSTPYEIPWAALRERKQAHEAHEERFSRDGPTA